MNISYICNELNDKKMNNYELNRLIGDTNHASNMKVIDILSDGKPEDRFQTVEEALIQIRRNQKDVRTLLDDYFKKNQIAKSSQD